MLTVKQIRVQDEQGYRVHLDQITGSIKRYNCGHKTDFIFKPTYKDCYYSAYGYVSGTDLTSGYGVGVYASYKDECFEEISLEEVEKAQAEQLRKNPLKAAQGISHGGSHSITGSDPELWIMNKGRMIPAFEVLPSKKENHGFFWDGYQAEFTTPTYTCHAFFVDGVQKRLKDLLTHVQRQLPEAYFSVKPVMRLKPSTLAKHSAQHNALGCDPSLNIYGAKPLKVDDPSKLPVRFAGCHMHYGVEKSKLTENVIKNSIRAMDQVGGTIITLALQGLEDPVRREFYGRAGEYRLPQHGLEWRTPSSALLMHPALTHLCFDVARWGFNIGFRGFNALWDQSDEETQEIVNELNIPLAKKVFNRNKELIKDYVLRRYGSPQRTEKFITLVTKGFANYAEDDVVKNWRLDKEWVGHSGSPKCCLATFLSAMD